MIAACWEDPPFFTHHFRATNDESGSLIGACTDEQADRVVKLAESTGQSITYRSFPAMGRAMHGQDPALFARTLIEWIQGPPR